MEKNWNDDVMESAFQDIISGKSTIRCAVLEYDVPKLTLHDRVSGKILPGAVSGPPWYLNNEEEEELVRWLEECVEVGI